MLMILINIKCPPLDMAKAQAAHHAAPQCDGHKTSSLFTLIKMDESEHDKDHASYCHSYCSRTSASVSLYVCGCEWASMSCKCLVIVAQTWRQSDVSCAVPFKFQRYALTNPFRSRISVFSCDSAKPANKNTKIKSKTHLNVIYYLNSDTNCLLRLALCPLGAACGDSRVLLSYFVLPLALS